MNSSLRVNTMKTSPAFPRSIVSILAMLAAVLALPGCLSKPPLHKQTFTFGAPEISLDECYRRRPCAGH